MRRWLGVGAAAIVMVFAGAVIAGALAINSLNDARVALVDQSQPAVNQTLRLTKALLDQETGLRGFVLTGQDAFLEPYRVGQAEQRPYVTRLHELLVADPVARDEFERVMASVDAWRAGYAEPLIAQVRATGSVAAESELVTGKARFDAVRTGLTTLQSSLDGIRDRAKIALSDSAGSLVVVCVIIAAVLLVVFIAIAVALRAAMVGPMSRLAGEVRIVAGGDFEHEVTAAGPLEVAQLGGDVDSMRRRIVDALEIERQINLELDISTTSLKRSNAELEQFAYVASHDLQEPLRKVASFCELLARRYQGQLDERADQYIAFAVDGAKRMQILINDLLAFSRVGRQTGKQALLPAGDLVAQAQSDLADVITETGAHVETGTLPTVRGERALLTAVFRNLISNAIKFRAADPPRVEITAEDEDGQYVFTVTDNGIGIEPEFADRIFVIFQRLHAKSEYPGTGIGLAMCRKIIEYHGGRIWLEPTDSPGSRFRFTLPVPSDSPTPSAPATTGDRR